MFCPHCRSEFREGFVRCEECDTDLIKELPPEPKRVYFKPTLIFTTSNIHEAHFVKGILEANNVFAIIFDDHVSSLNPFLTNAVGGIKVAVAKSDLDDAKEVLIAYRAEIGKDAFYGDASPFG